MRADKSPAANTADKKRDGSSHSSLVQSLLDIWNVLAASSAEKPLTISEIANKLDARRAAAASATSSKTARRYLPHEIEAINTLNPQTVLCSDQEAAILHTYSSEDTATDPATGKQKKQETLHVVVEDRFGNAAWSGEMTAVLKPGSVNPISQKTLDRRLPTLMRQFKDLQNSGQLPPITLSAVVKNENGRYVSALKQEEKQLAEGTDGGKSSTRRYYLESILNPGEWKILSDMVKVYPYISEQDTAKYLSALQRIAPGVDHWSSSRAVPKMDAHIQFQHIDILDKAIRGSYLVNLRYGRYRLNADENGKLLPALVPMPDFKRPGRPYVMQNVEPYAMIWANGYYYLVCRIPTFDSQGNPRLDENGVPCKEMRNLRLDRILHVTVPTSDGEVFPFEKDKAFHLYEYRDRSPVMHPGVLVDAHLRCPESMLSTLQDFFGKSILRYTKPQEEDTLPLSKRFTEVTVKASEKGIRLFALQYADRVEVLSPESLRSEVAQTLKDAAAKYQ